MRRVLVACWFGAACASAPPLRAPSWAAGAEDPRFPRAQFISAAGVSQLGALAADDAARSAVSTQISARLESETSAFAHYSSRSGDTAENVTARVSVRSSFDRADLIRIVERTRQGEAFWALAVLDRSAADRELAAAAAADLSRFQTAAAVASGARASGDGGVFATAAADASRLRSGLDSTFILRRAIALRSAPEEREYVAARNRLLAQIEEARSRRVVGIVVKGDGSARLADFAVNAVRKLGLRPDSTSCAARAAQERTDATQLEVDPEESCAHGTLGERCELTVRLVAHACSGGTAGVGTIGGIRALHPSDREKARRGAWEKVTADAIDAAVRQALQGALLGE